MNFICNLSPISCNFETTRNAEICVQRQEIHPDIVNFGITNFGIHVVSTLREIGETFKFFKYIAKINSFI